jgi:peptidoglycan hydrolase-like protein with peptidoglycan-binding domain
MKYSIQNEIRVVEVPTKDFRIILYDAAKKSMGKNRCNAGFFASYSESGSKFTLPVSHLVCDFSATSKWTKKYCTERGKFKGDKFTFDASRWSYSNEFYGRFVSTLIVKDGKASVESVRALPSCDYAVSGVPVLANGAQVGANTAYSQGWNSSSLYATWHVFIGLKNADTVYVMAARTSTGNMLTSGEMAKKFKSMGFRDVIKLDGGGSFYFNTNGTTLSTAENRRVCSIIDFGEVEGNPYPTPTVTLYKGIKNATAVSWLQYELNSHGYSCSVDGSFGPATLAKLKAYQKANGLVVDGYCGPATRASLTR